MGCLEIICLLATCLILMSRTSNGGGLNWTEYISMNIGFSVYAGWVTSATILKVWFLLKSWGVQEPQYDEEKLGVITLWLALAVYVGITVYGGHSWYGAVFVWTILAIRNNGLKHGFSEITKNCERIAILHSTFLGAYIGYSWMAGILAKSNKVE